MIEKRQHPRIDVNTSVWVGQDGIFSKTNSLIRNLSIGGLFLEVDGYYSVGDVLSLRFQIPDTQSMIICTAIIRNVREGVGFGVEFLDLSAQPKQILEAYILQRVSSF